MLIELEALKRAAIVWRVASKAIRKGPKLADPVASEPDNCGGVAQGRTRRVAHEAGRVVYWIDGGGALWGGS